MFRIRFFERIRFVSSALNALNAVQVLTAANGRILVPVLRLREREIDSYRVERTREVSRAYIAPYQGNR